MVFRAKKEDIPTAADFAARLFSSPAEEMEKEFETLISSESGALFLLTAADTPVGFAQCQLRHDYVEGTGSSPVGYLEGIYVLPEYRNRGYALELLVECEQWARAQGCTEFASDCQLVNEAGLTFHLKAGFTEVNRIVCFTKKL